MACSEDWISLSAIIIPCGKRCSRNKSGKHRVLRRPPVAREISLTRKECLNVALKIREGCHSGYGRKGRGGGNGI